MAKSRVPTTLSRRAFSLSALAAAASFNVRAQAQTGALYAATDLGRVSGYGGVKAIAINERGQVAGNLDNAVLQANEAFFWTADGTDDSPENPQMHPLGNLSGRPDWLFNGSMASALNSRAQVVGCGDGTGELVDAGHAVLWEPDGRVIDLGTLMKKVGMSSMATGLNNIGKIVGWSDSDYGTLDWFKHRRAFVYEIGTRQMTDLGIDHSEANAINDWNEIVGAYRPDQYHEHAVYWHPSGRAYDLHKTVTAGGDSSRATAINDRGQVVGWSDDAESGNHRGFFYDLRTGVVKHADVPYVGARRHSRAYAINNRGQAVGTFRADILNYHALLWNTETGAVEDLNLRIPPDQQWHKSDDSTSQSYWSLQEAWGINNQGQIVGGGGRFFQGHYWMGAFLLNRK
jgi:probable HAF family extracellular repeat protein